MEKALLIFIKNPALGKVKTRLAKTVGAYNALKIYQHLLERTNEITEEAEADKFLYYNDFIPTSDNWSPMEYTKSIQRGPTLGDKMELAFSERFEEGYRRVLLIMPDCPKLNESHIDRAFNQLETHDLVIGPSTDGSFYALGMNRPIAEIFAVRKSESDSPAAGVLQAAEKLGLKVFRLPELTDVDLEEDLGKLEKMIDAERR